MKNIKAFLVVVLATLSSLLGVSCIESKTYKSPPGYDLNNPEKYNMPEKLTEISGLAFKNGNADSVYAEEDETGRVYYFKPGDKQIQHAEFGKDGDYEDIAVVSNQVVMMRSDATFFIFPVNNLRSAVIDGVQKISDVLPKGEYEGMYADERANQLYVLCKNCKIDNASKTNSGYILDIDATGTIKQSGQFNVSVKEITAITGQKKITFHPSAITKNKGTNEWYILSSVNKMLVVTGADWKVKNVYPLNPSLFIQPEGMAFDVQRNLYISNEGDEITPGNILKFKYKK